jgi:hypothetical protein
MAGAHAGATGGRRTVAHEVQAGSARVKLRSVGLVLILSIITRGIASIVFWALTLRDIEGFEKTERGSSGVHQGIDLGIPIIGFFASFFVLSFPGNQSTSVDPATGATVTQSDGGGSSMFLGVLILYVTWLVMAGRMRGHINRVCSHAGMLPEDRPSAGTYWLLCALGPLLGTCAAVSQLNDAWKEFPRYYASIGGTKEAIVTRALDEPAPAAQAVAAAPAPIVGVSVPAASIATAPPVAIPLTPAARMQQLAAQVTAGSITSAESLEYAELVEQLHGHEQAAQWYAYVATHDPTCRKASWWYGTWLLGRGDVNGISMLHRVMGDPAYDHWARERVADFLVQQGRAAEAAAYRPAA